MSTRVDVTDFAPHHAQQIADLTASAFGHIAEFERPVGMNAARIGQWLGPANPAGPSVVAIATVDDRPVGCCTDIAFRFRTAAGAILVTHQMAFLFVSSAAQGKGLGRSLLATVTRHFSHMPDSFVYRRKYD